MVGNCNGRWWRSLVGLQGLTRQIGLYGCPVPDDHVGPSRFPLFFARDVLHTLIAEMEAEYKSWLAAASPGFSQTMVCEKCC
jgi:hypothetical protein